MTQIGTRLTASDLYRLEPGDTVRCTAEAEVTPGRTTMNVGCQRFTLNNLLANGGTIGEYTDGRATVTFVGVWQDRSMRVPFHETPQPLGNLEEYVREAVVIEPLTLQQTRYVRERLYRCEAHPNHLFVVTAGADNVALISRVDLTAGHSGYTAPSVDGFLDHPDCRPAIAAGLARIISGHNFATPSPRLVAKVTADQLPGNTEAPANFPLAV